MPIWKKIWTVYPDNPNLNPNLNPNPNLSPNPNLDDNALTGNAMIMITKEHKGPKIYQVLIGNLNVLLFNRIVYV